MPSIPLGRPLAVTRVDEQSGHGCHNGEDRSKVEKAVFSAKRLSPDWMKGVKNCLFAVKPHFSNARHKREEGIAATDLLKAKHPLVLLSTEPQSAVVHMVSKSSAKDEDQDKVQWAQNNEEDKQYAAMAFMS